MVAHLTRDIAPVQLITYPDAHHAFNSPTLKGHPMIKYGHHVEYNEAATKAANFEIQWFLTAHLSP